MDKNIDQAAIEAKRAYEKEWRAKNKDKVKAWNERYWKKKAKQLAQETKN